MVTNKKTFGKAASLPMGIASGVAGALLLTLAFAVLITQLVLGERISDTAIGYWAAVAIPASSAAGAFIAVGMVKRRRMQVCLITGSAYFVCLTLLNILFFGGQFQGVGGTLLLSLLGGGIIGFLSARGKKRSGRKYKKFHSR